MESGVTFTIESDDRLLREVWSFWLQGRNLVLDIYRVEARETRRHAYRPLKSYARIPLVAVVQSRQLTARDVPLTDEIRERALREFTSQIKVCFWSEVRS